MIMRLLKQCLKPLKQNSSTMLISLAKEALELALFDYVNWFNNIRIHGSLNYRTPAEYKREQKDKSSVI